MDEEIVRLVRVSKRFPGVRALDGVSLSVRRGEVHVVVGENGAGKSTLVKIIAGAERQTGGSLYWEGGLVESHSPRRARAMGVNVIYQEFSLAENMTVAANVFLGREPRYGGALALLDGKLMKRRASAFIERLGARLDPERPAGELGVAGKQLVEIARALAFAPKLIIFDEPTSALSVKETGKLFDIIAGLKASGVAVVYISHRLSEVFRVGDRFTVLRNGRVAGTGDVRRADERGLVRMMTGKELEGRIRRPPGSPGGELLRLEGVCRRGQFEDIGLTLRSGEIVGLGGLVGAGRTELARTIFGAARPDGGRIYLYGAAALVRSPRDAVRRGIALLPEDRGRDGLVPTLDVASNISLANMASVARCGIIARKKLRERAGEMIERLSIRSAGLDEKVASLSGGNQQKIVLAKWLLSRARIFIFDEPTRGIDVGAREEIYGLMNELTSRGAGIIMISSDLGELLRMSDRVLVMHAGRITGSFSRQEMRRENILRCAFGGSAENEGETGRTREPGSGGRRRTRRHPSRSNRED